jgi:hypothetical protein
MAVLTREWLGPSEAARELGISLSRLRLIALEGKLPYTSTPLGRLFAAEDVARLRAERAARRSAQGDPDAAAYPNTPARQKASRSGSDPTGAAQSGLRGAKCGSPFALL